MLDDIKFVVATGREGRPIAGLDTVIAPAPDGLYATVEGKRAIVARRLHPLLRNLSEDGAAKVGEELHHAEWIITTDPDVVQTTAITSHDCVTCRAGADQAAAFMKEHPGAEILVGVLYWAG